MCLLSLLNVTFRTVCLASQVDMSIAASFSVLFPFPALDPKALALICALLRSRCDGSPYILRGDARCKTLTAEKSLRYLSASPAHFWPSTRACGCQPERFSRHTIMDHPVSGGASLTSLLQKNVKGQFTHVHSTYCIARNLLSFCVTFHGIILILANDPRHLQTKALLWLVL